VIDEHKAIRESTRGAKAQELLNNEMLTEAFEILEQNYISAWRATHVNDQTSREKLFLAINVVGKVKQHLETAVSNGSMSAKDLKDLAEESERKKRFGIFSTK
jgi:hypothetical protein